MSLMGSTDRRFFRHIDRSFIVIILVLNAIGLFCLYSATHGAHHHVSSRFIAQLIWLSGSWLLFFVITLVDYQFFSRIAYFIYAINLGALALIPFIGKSFYGAKRWLDLGFFNYQPSETMKIAIILVLAKILAKKSKPEGLGFFDLLLPLAYVTVPFILIAKQPDLGTALMLFGIAATMVLFVKVKKSILIISVVCSLAGGVLAWNFALKDYQKQRVVTFLNPEADPQGAGYNSIQSKIAVGSGMFKGKGYLKGTQSQLEFLPERHTDFIFSVLSEEFGFIGSFLTLLTFGVLYLRGISFASLARDKFGALIAIGGISYIFWHMFVNISMVVGLMPIVGVPLPLISYGGSGMLATMTSLGLVSSVGLRKNLF